MTDQSLDHTNDEAEIEMSDEFWELMKPQCPVIAYPRPDTNKDCPIITRQRVIDQVVSSVCSNDTSEINWWQTGTPGPTDPDEYEAICPIFNDNVVFYAFRDEDEHTTANAPTNSRDKAFLLGWCKKHNVRSSCISCIGSTRVYADGSQTTPTKWNGQHVKAQLQAFIESRAAHPSSAHYVHHYKLSTSRASRSQIHIALESHLDELNKQFIFFQDMDATQDFACTVTPEVLANVQLTHDVISRARCDKSIASYLAKYAHNTDTPPDKVYKVANEDKVGKNCYTFLFCKDGHAFRAKIYNKFVQTLESSSVRTNIGSHLMDWIANPDKRTDTAIKHPLTQQRGFTRIEITFYEKTPHRSYVDQTMKELKRLFLPGCNYTSIQDQWVHIDRILCASTYIYDLNARVLRYIRWTNKLTGKCNGWQTSPHVTPTDFQRLLEWTSFRDLPIHLIALNYNTPDNPSSADYPGDTNQEGEWKTNEVRDVCMSAMAFTRAGSFTGSVLTPNGNPLYNPRKGVSLDPMIVGLCPLSHFEISIPDHGYRQLPTRDSKLTPNSDISVELAAILKRTIPYKRKFLERSRKVQPSKRLKAFHSQRPVGCKLFHTLPCGRYIVRNRKTYTYRTTERSAVLLDTPSDECYAITHDLHEKIQGLQCPFAIQLLGTRLIDGVKKAVAIVDA